MANAMTGAPLGASYTLVECVGKGASGQVWSLQHAKKSEQLVAKILHPHLAQDSAVVERFVRERSVLLGLEHEHIVRVRDLVVEGNTLALVMDYFGGGSLRDVLKNQGNLPPAIALRITAVILETLAYAHGKNIVHRDIKPDNILFSDAGVTSFEDSLHITDFGISSIITADHAKTTGMVGTPYYLPPELISRGVGGPAGDVYSTGILLYELLAGRTPFAGEGTDFTIAYRHVNSEVPHLDVPEILMQALLSLLHKNPGERPHPLEAAAHLRSLAKRFEHEEALPLAYTPEQFDESSHAETVVRGLNVEAEHNIPAADELPAPVLGEALGATIVKPQRIQRADLTPPRSDSTKDFEKNEKNTSKALLLGVLGTVLLLGSGWAIYWAVTSSAKPSDPFTVMGQQESPLPTGLAVRREATYNPASSTIDLTITYSAQKAPLSGEFLEVLPAVSDDGSCPNAVWEGGTAERNQPSITDMNVECGWAIKELEIQSNQQREIKASVSAEIVDEQQLADWLSQVSEQTNAAISSQEYKSTAYPAQRITDIEVKVPARTVSQAVVPVTLLPVWPSGADALNPLYLSENGGKPTGMLQSIAGSQQPVRFSDGCSGRLMVDDTGVRVTALSVSEQCSVLAQVGNFTDLRSANFVITMRD